MESQYANCLGIRFHKAIVSDDLVRMFAARNTLKMHLTPTDAQVQKVVEYVNTYRNGLVGSPQHMLMVAHSYGNAVVAEAMRLLPQREGHALNFAPTCLASLSLASVVDRSSFDVEDPYKLGFMLKGDLPLNLIPPPTGWESISTPETDAILARTPDDMLSLLYAGYQIHSVDNMYLGTTVAKQKVVELATTLHKECLQGELTLDPSSVTATLGDEFTITPVLKNQNGRRLYGRKYSWQNVAAEAYVNTPAYLPSDSAVFRFRALTLTPGTTWAVDTWPYYALHETLAMQVNPPPLGQIGAGSYAEKDTSWYESTQEGYNGGLGDGGVVKPEGDWDGSATCPSTIRRVYGYTGPSGTAWEDFQLRCVRSYTFYRGNVTDPALASQVDHYEWQQTSAAGATGGFSAGGDSVSVGCGGPSYCVGAMTVRAVNANGMPLAISDPIAVSGGTSPSPYRAPNAARAPLPASNSATVRARREVAP